MGQGQRTLRSRRFGLETGLLAALAIWSLVPLVVLLGGHGVFNGSDGIQVGDHMQYLSFIRDSGEHLLVSNRFDVVPDPHYFLPPINALSGLLWRLGASIQVAFLVWQPVAVAVLFLGFAAYVRRLLGPDRLAVAAGLLLALFYFSPAAPLADWLGGSPTLQFGTLTVGLESFAAAYPWGGFTGSIAIGLMPIFLLGVERVLDPARRQGGHSARLYALGTGAAGLLTSWLHPWQGITLLLIVAGLVVWSRFARRYLSLAVPVIMTAAPLAYMWALSHTNSSWHEVTQPNNFPHLGSWLWLGLAPALLALPGYPGRNLDLQERMLRIWPVAALLMYFTLHSSWFYHAFAGLSLPLAILAVKGWRRLRLPRLVAVATAVAVTVPGMVFAIQKLHDGRADHFFEPDERQALRYLDDARRPGPVLAPLQPLGQAVPGFTGRNTYVGHYAWTPDYQGRVDRTEALFDGRLGQAAARTLVSESRARFLAADCRGRVDLRRLLGPLVARVRRVGCVTIYEVRR